MFHISKLLLTHLLSGEASFFHTLQPVGGARSLLLLFFFNYFIFIFIIYIFYFFNSLELFWLLPAADDFEKQCLLHSLLSDWPVPEISSQQLNHYFPTQLLLSVNACMLCTCDWNLSRMLGYQELTNACDVVMNPTVCC